MKKHLIALTLSVFTVLQLNAQTTTLVTLSNGDGWYRIIEGGGHTSSLIRVSGAMGNNKLTDITMYVSMMAYDQGGSINIVSNKFYNQNHIDEIRAGTSDGKYILDVHLVGINTPTTMGITSYSASVLSSPIFNPSGSITGEIKISGRVIGTTSTRWPIYFSENVGIGTTTPDEKLAVNGNIHTKEVRVDLIGWSDFVFKDNYHLPTLTEVEQHIKDKGHLKDIPSAEEVKANGIFLGDMDSKLLQKIEELTLYTIDQEKRIETLESKNNELIALVEKLINKKSE